MKHLTRIEHSQLLRCFDEFTRPMIAGRDYELISTEAIISHHLDNWFPVDFSEDNFAHEF